MMGITGFTKVKVWVGLVAVWGTSLWAECPPCGIQGSSVCRPWGKGQAYFKWATGDQTGSSITLTAGPCGQPGETGTAYILSCVDNHKSLCDSNPNTNPCGESVITDDGTFAVIKVTGNSQAFQHIFPNGLGVQGDYWSQNQFQGISVLQTNCEYVLRLGGPSESRMILNATVAQCDSQYSGSHFSIDVKLYQKRDVNNEVYSYLSHTSGSITVKNNARTSFDPLSFIPDVRSGTAIGYIEKITRRFNSENEWKLNRKAGYPCSDQNIWVGPALCYESGHCDIPAQSEIVRVKYPGFKYPVTGSPAYVGLEGWSYSGTSNPPYIQYKGPQGTVLFICNSPADSDSGCSKMYIQKVVLSSDDYYSENDTVLWNCSYTYNSPAKLEYIHTPDDANSLADRYYYYTWSNNDHDLKVTYTRSSDSSQDREWNVKFDEQGRAIQYINGNCSTGCGTSEFEHVEYHPEFDDLITKRYNANNQLILENTYTPISYTEYVNTGLIPVGNPSFEIPVQTTCGVPSGDILFWGDPSTAQICPDSSSPDGDQILRPCGDTLIQNTFAPILETTTYKLSAWVRATPNDNNNGTATIQLRSSNQTIINPLISLSYSENQDGSDGRVIEQIWDSTGYIGSEDDELIISITGNHSDIDNIQLSAVMKVEHQTKPILTQQVVYNPQIQTSHITLTRAIHSSPSPLSYWIEEKSYIDSNHYRLTRYDYTDETYTNLKSKTEYSDLGIVSPVHLPEVPFTYAYSYTSDPNGRVEKTTYPNGNREDFKITSELTNLDRRVIKTYRHDVPNDSNSLAEQDEYLLFDSGINYEYKLTSHTNPRGGVTTYEYSENSPYLLGKRTDPDSGAGNPITQYQYNGNRQVTQETRTLSSTQSISSGYQYDPNGLLLSRSDGNGWAITQYRNNDFGQVIRQNSPDGVVTGKTYGTGGELLSEFVLRDPSAINQADTSLWLISQTKYSYTPEGKIQTIEKAKDDEPFEYNTPNDGWIITRNEYDPWGRKIKTIEDYQGKNLTTEYVYNLQGEIEKVLYPSGTNPFRKWVKTVRDGRGLVTQEQTGYTENSQDTVLLQTTTAYNDNGNIQQQTLPDGTDVFYTYDNIDRIKTISKGTETGPCTEKFYNSAGNVEREIYVDVDETILKDIRRGFETDGKLKWERICATPGQIDNAKDQITHNQYDRLGNLQYVIRKNINRTEFDPDPNDLTVENRYDPMNRRQQTVDPKGHLHSVFHSAGGLALKIVDPNDPADPNAYTTIHSYSYGRLDTTIDPEKHYTLNTYNSLNQLIRQTVYDRNDPENSEDDFPVRQTRNTYDNLGNLIRTVVLKDPASGNNYEPVEGYDRITEFLYNDNTGLLEFQKTWYGDPAVESIVELQYDKIGRKINTIDPEGNEEQIHFSSTNSAQVEKILNVQMDSGNPNTFYTVTTFFVYDPTYGRLEKKILDTDGDGEQESTDSTYTYQYDGLDRIVLETAPDGIQTKTRYDLFGNVDQVIEDYDSQSGNALNKTTEYIYNRLNQLYQVKAYDPKDDQSGTDIQTTEYAFDNNGNTTTITYPDTETIQYEYNLLDKVETETKRDGTEIHYAYDYRGDLILESGNDTDNTPYEVYFEFDGAGNRVYAEKILDNQIVSESVFQYNGFGLAESEETTYVDLDPVTTLWTYDGSGNITSQTHNNTTLTYTQDGLGRILTIDRDETTIVQYAYLGNSAKSIEYPQAEITETYAYDELGRVDEIQSVDGDSQPILDFGYSYDLAGNRQQEQYKHLSGDVYDKYYFDNLRRLWKAEYASTSGFARVDDYLHDLSKTVLLAELWLDRDQTLETLAQQHIQLLHQRELHAQTAIRNNRLEPIVRRFNDGQMPVLQFVEFGELSDDAKTRSETYRDEKGQLIAQILWDQNDRITLFCLYPDVGGKVVVTSTYGKDGKPASQICSTYDPKGVLLQREDMLALVAAEALKAASSSSLKVSDSLKSPDGGMILMSIPESPIVSQEQFDYDHLGNRYQYTGKDGIVSTYSHNSINQYSQRFIDNPAMVDDVTLYFTHDDNGNLTDDGENNTFGYDYRDRLISADFVYGQDVTFTYDALGRRIRKVVDDQTTWFYYDLSGQVIAEYEQISSGDPVLVRSFVYGNGTDEILAMFRTVHEGDLDDWQAFLDFCDAWLSTTGQGNFNAALDHVSDGKIDIKDFAWFASVWNTPSFQESDFYYLHDALGSVRGLIGGRYNRETDREFYNYDVYGGPSNTTEPSVAGNPLRFAGYRYDAETGFYDLRNRTYDPIYGRFLQHDPIGYADSMNLYEYALSNPTNYVDPWGLISRGELWDSINSAKSSYGEVLNEIKTLGTMAQNGNSSDDELFTQARKIQDMYRNYRSQYSSLMSETASFIGDQWWPSKKDQSAINTAFGLNDEDELGATISLSTEDLLEEKKVCRDLCAATGTLAGRTTVMHQTAKTAEAFGTIAGAAGGATLLGGKFIELGAQKGAVYLAKQVALLAATQVGISGIEYMGTELGANETQIRVGVAALQALMMYKSFTKSNSLQECKALPPPGSSQFRGRAGITDKIAKQMGPRGWTPEKIVEAVKSGKQIPAINKATGNAATRYVHPQTGQSVVIDTVTNEVIHVGGPGFKYGPKSGDLP